MDMKFRAHDTFFIRKGWLSKGMRNVIADKDVFITKDKDRNPMDVLGIGANMVKALRYWLQAVGLTEEPSKGQRFQYLTELGQIIYDQDPYIEEIGTLWLLQYQLAKTNGCYCLVFLFQRIQHGRVYQRRVRTKPSKLYSNGTRASRRSLLE